MWRKGGGGGVSVGAEKYAIESVGTENGTGYSEGEKESRTLCQWQQKPR